MNIFDKKIFLALILVMVLSLSACGGSGDDLSVGDPAPDFELPSADGSVISLSDYDGQSVLLYFHMAVG